MMCLTSQIIERCLYLTLLAVTCGQAASDLWLKDDLDDKQLSESDAESWASVVLTKLQAL